MATTEQRAPAQAEKRQHYGITFAVLAFGTLSYTLLQSLVLPALPTLQTQLHTSESSVAWVLTAYLLSASIATPILGRLGDMYGKEKMLLVVFGGIVLGAVLGGLSTSMSTMIVARVVQGTGGAIFPLSFGIIRDEFPAERVSGGIGLLSTIIGVGGGGGIILGGPIIQHLSYHWLFWIPAVLSFASLVTAWRFIPESPVRAPGRINYLSAALLSGWLTALLVAVSMGSIWGWSSVRVLGLLVAAAALGVLWVRTELRTDHPLIDMRMMRIPTVWWTNIAALLFGVGMYSSIVLIPPYLQTASSHGYGFGASPTLSGLFLAPNAGAMLITGFLIGTLTARFGSKLLLVAGGAMGTASFAMLMFSSAAEWEFLFATTVSGLGIGLAFAAMSNLVVEAVPDTQTGAATGMNANIRTIGGAVGSAIVASILASQTVDGVPPLRSYSLSFGVLAIAFLLATAAAAVVPVQRWRAGSAAAGMEGAVPDEVATRGPVPRSVLS
ncbi:MAG TPA: MFS transporter [Acidimicrobiales bacterium]|nr:MFS transporter [Acidimicrobiales bacterium]